MKSSSDYEIWLPWMNRAIHLALLAEGDTSPNPLVGAVVLDKEGNLVGEGFHSKSGQPHAESIALSQARERSIGGTLIVNLEPCCHQGRTPPCTEAILNAGIVRVVVAIKDPDKRVSGRGINRLKEAGVEVITGVQSNKAKEINKSFIFRVKKGKPWGILKWAMSIDGRTALPNGSSQWISNANSRKFVHQLRAKSDAVIVGGETIRSDNPLLTSRGLSIPEPLRVIFTRSSSLPIDSQIWDTSMANTLIAHTNKKFLFPKEKSINGLEGFFLDEANPCELLEHLAKKGCNKVLWECGSSLAALALKKDLIQEVAVFVAPKLLGGEEARTPIGDLGLSSISNAMMLEETSLLKSHSDLLLKGFVKFKKQDF